MATLPKYVKWADNEKPKYQVMNSEQINRLAIEYSPYYDVYPYWGNDFRNEDNLEMYNDEGQFFLYAERFNGQDRWKVWTILDI